MSRALAFMLFCLTIVDVIVLYFGVMMMASQVKAPDRAI